MYAIRLSIFAENILQNYEITGNLFYTLKKQDLIVNLYKQF